MFGIRISYRNKSVFIGDANFVSSAAAATAMLDTSYAIYQHDTRTSLLCEHVNSPGIMKHKAQFVDCGTLGECLSSEISPQNDSYYQPNTFRTEVLKQLPKNTKID
jgi:hypothetical protein